MGFTDPYWGLRPRVYGPFLLVWNVMLIAFVVGNLFTAEVSRWVSPPSPGCLPHHPVAVPPIHGRRAVALETKELALHPLRGNVGSERSSALAVRLRRRVRGLEATGAWGSWDQQCLSWSLARWSTGAGVTQYRTHPRLSWPSQAGGSTEFPSLCPGEQGG